MANLMVVRVGTRLSPTRRVFFFYSFSKTRRALRQAARREQTSRFGTRGVYTIRVALAYHADCVTAEEALQVWMAHVTEETCYEVISTT